MSYDANSIQIRDFRTACRATPGMYLGASGQDAAFNCFLEVLNNSCDEAMMGRGDTIEIILSDDGNTLTCSDAGAGVPSGPNKDCKEVLIELFCSAHSSGKFDTTNYKKCGWSMVLELVPFVFVLALLRYGAAETAPSTI